MTSPSTIRSRFALLILITLIGLVVPAIGQFETRATTKLPEGAYAIASGDFNNDGFADVVVIDGNGFTVSLGNGDGTFQKPTFFKNQLSYSLAVGDFNNDGNQDIVVANLDPSTVQVYLGNGNGTFRQPISSNTTEGSYFVAVGDFNNDKKADLALIDPPYISILLGKGNGKFEAPIDNNSFTGAIWLATGDFNNDHHLDVLVTGSFGSSYQVGVLLGNGNGTLQDPINTPVEYVPSTVAAGDFNGDGKLDAVLGYDLAGLAVFIGNGDGTFQPATNYDTTGLGGGYVVVSDLNLDGKPDLVVPSGPPALDIFWGNGDGTFQAAQGFASSVGGLPAVCDLNGDHLPDVVMANPEYGTGTMLNTGVASFSPTAPLSFTASGEQVLKLTNDGTKSLSISAITVSGSAFKIRSACGNSIRAGASCDITVLFKPEKAGTYTGLITLRDSASSKPQFIELSGNEN
jgi:FG-GAP-like repeat